MQESLSQLRHGLPPRGLLGLTFDLRSAPFPPPRRVGAFGVLDITEYVGESSGGIRTYLDAKAAWVARHPDVRQTIVVPGRVDALVEGEGSRTYQLHGPPIPFNPPYRFLLSTTITRRIIEHERPDLIEIGSHLLVPWVARRANRGARVPMVWFYHGHLPRLIAPDHQRGSAQRALETLAWRYVRRLARDCRAVIVASPSVADELSAHGVPNVEQVPLGVDLEHFNPRRRGRAGETRRRAGLPDGPLALFAGRFAREKHLDLLLDAWAPVERRTGARLALLGNGPQVRALRKHPYASRVHWLPFETDRERLADLLAAIDVYLAPGPYETFGLAALEAMASGTPILTVDRGGVAERVAATGGGMTYPFNDRAGFSTAAIELFRGDLGAFGMAGRRSAERHHGWDASFSRLFATYRGILGRTP